jgi:hypothetical protein
MRIVTTPSFCKVCVEGLWHALLQRLDLIDGVFTFCEKRELGSPVQRVIELNLVHLAQFREDLVGAGASVDVKEAFVVNWKRGSESLPVLQNQTRIEVDDAPDTYSVEVQFLTDEVRSDPKGYLRSFREFAVPKC